MALSTFFEGTGTGTLGIVRQAIISVRIKYGEDHVIAIVNYWWVEDVLFYSYSYTLAITRTLTIRYGADLTEFMSQLRVQ